MWGNDQERFESLYRSTYRDVTAYSRRRLPPDDWEDAVAEIYRLAWQKRDEFLGADKPVAWLLAVGFKVVSSRYRKRTRLSLLTDKIRKQPAPSQAGPERELLAATDIESAHRALRELKLIDQELIRLAAFEGLPYADIAQITGLSETAVRTRIHRARRKLRGFFDRLDGGAP